jgi:small subunit ribosomal protein S13
MIRIAGKSIDEKKQIRFALTPIKGIGKSNIKKLLAILNIAPTTKIVDLDEEVVTKIRNTIDSEFVTEANLRRFDLANIKHYIDVKSYRGDRLNKKLPARGQRTKTNSRTVRGNKKNSGASGKIKAKK